MAGTRKVEKQAYQKATDIHKNFFSTLTAVKLSRKQQQSRLGTRMKHNSHWNTLTSEAVIRWIVPHSSTHRARRCSMSIQRMSQLCQAVQLLASKNTAFSMLVVVLHSSPLMKSTEHFFCINWNPVMTSLEFVLCICSSEVRTAIRSWVSNQEQKN